jgi:metallo-beta-lactamase family protein
MISLAFHGAAQTVTGSKYLLRAGRETFLLDCGVFQGLKELRLRNWDSPPFSAHKLPAIVLTHAHVDHIGYLPRLYKFGFRGTVFCSGPTARLAEILLLDAAHLHEEDAHFLNKTRATRHEPALPLFTTDDAKAVLKHFKAVPMEEDINLSPGISFAIHPIGHILGAGSVTARLNDGGQSKTIRFSGDIGRYGVPLIPDPLPPSACDYLVLESTYGDRLHPAIDPWDALAELVNRIVETGAVLLIPSFAVGRSQQLVYMLRGLEERGMIPPVPVHVDSPMAIDATEIFCDFPTLHRVNLAEGGAKTCRLYGPNITYHRTRGSSQAINAMKGPRVIISASGMLTGGRILHHLIHRGGDPSNIIAFAGFQAMGTRGRDLVDGKTTVRFHGREHTIRAQVTRLGGLSGHADYSEIMTWLGAMETPPKMTFVTHGEPEPAAAMAQRVGAERGFSATLPELGDEFEL